MKKQIFVFAIITVFCLFAAGCQKKEESASAKEPVSQDIFAMDTYMTVTAYGDAAKDAVSDAVLEIERLDGLLSTGNEESEVYALNAAGGGKISEDTAYLLERSLEIWKDTEGKFEIAIYPLMEAWGFADGNYKVPSAESLQRLLTLADSADIIFDEKNAAVSFKKEGMKIDFGGIAKGYTSARIMDIFREHGITSGMVSLGGNVQVMGSKPDGSLWRVAIQNPSDTGAYLGVLETKDRAVITSGGYERYFEQDGVAYHHILDPATGCPADSGLTSVTIVSADGTLADALSTSLFIMGRERALDYWQDHSDEFDTILMEEDGTLYVTEGIAEQFTSEAEVNVIKRQS